MSFNTNVHNVFNGGIDWGNIDDVVGVCMTNIILIYNFIIL